MRYTCLDVRSPDVNFLRKVMSSSRHDGAAYSRHPCRQSADADIVSAFPLSFSTFLENINILRQTSSTWHRILREFCVLEYKAFVLYLPFFIIWVSATKQASHTHKLSTEWVSATKQASDTHKLFIVWVSATKQASHTLKLFTAWVSATKQASHTLKLSTAWVSATKQASHTLKLFIAWVSAAKQASHTLKLS